ncbi:hypothetical protein TRFO_33193 [Tritrichomonas foetus]|uniref:Peptidase M60 domain-containing protein n=1 Tax=Tritrichomonas foetus TaxID=1144522 RepID=A0A1J4JMA9_9EUKA|nr:hypothetical protein TRFO_33193 [Tritrichomonas foetus]|eukprot:OHT00203.1 hypothetical protein TRFO_33193 [Tritrichomonas foetus]
MYGLSYSQCSLSVENEPRYEIEVAPKYEFVKNIRFPEISDLLANINSHQDRHGVSQTEHIDDIVTALRYYVMVSGENEVGIVSKLYDISFDYLKQTNYRVDDNICPLTTQEIIAVLLEVVSNKLPVDKMTVHPDIDLFPGLIENLQLGNHEVEVVLKHQQLLSTELWVAAGEIATIECSPHLNMGRQIGYQIGIHNTPLLTKRGPWHRWPTVITSFDLDKEVLHNLEGCFILQ